MLFVSIETKICKKLGLGLKIIRRKAEQSYERNIKKGRKKNPVKRYS